MAEKLKDKVAVVTGSGAGIGRAVALAMAREGAKVVTNNRQPGSQGGDAELTAKQIRDMGGQAVPFFGDVGDFETARKLVQTAIDSFGKIDILANIAGFSARKLIWEMTEDDFDRVVRASLKGSFNCVRHACGIMMQQRWGRIINTASLAWLRTSSNCNYAAAKAGLIGLTRAVAIDLKDYNITCNAIAPIARSRGMGTPEASARFKQMYEAGRITKSYYEIMSDPPDPETVTPLVIYLCTNEAADISGHLFRIAGGNIGHCWQPLNRKSINKSESLWTVEELAMQVPNVLLEGYVDPIKI